VFDSFSFVSLRLLQAADPSAAALCVELLLKAGADPNAALTAPPPQDPTAGHDAAGATGRAQGGGATALLAAIEARNSELAGDFRS